ncbi:MAG TPA: CAP domain-containing protein [Acidimicrobiales bacterium]
MPVDTYCPSRRSVPRRLRRTATAVALAGGLVALGPSIPASASISIINADRAGSGLAPLAESSGLDALAASHAVAMANANSLFHTPNLGAAIGSVVPGWTAVAENVGVGPSLSAVNTAFMGSSTHRANILGPYTVAGLGTFTSFDGRLWVVEEFTAAPGSPAPAPAPRAASIVQPAAPASAGTVVAGITAARPAMPPVASILSLGAGYSEIGTDGATFSYAGATFVGSLAGHRLAAPVLSAAATPSGAGAWLAGADGGVFGLGDATYLGGMNGRGLNAPVVAIAATPCGTGYWLASSDGGVFAMGTAPFLGSEAGHLAAPVVAMAATPTGHGYWLVGRDGGVFAFGDAPYLGGVAGQALAAPITGMAPTPSGQGYWLSSADGGVFAFGDATFGGGLSGVALAAPVVGIAVAPGGGYRLVGSDGGVFNFGGATFSGSAATLPVAGWPA